MKNYTVLVEGREVAGQRNPGAGNTIRLSDAQAEHPLRLGHIELTPPPVENSAPVAKAKPAAL
jgi:hypothetical protein